MELQGCKKHYIIIIFFFIFLILYFNFYYENVKKGKERKKMNTKIKLNTNSILNIQHGKKQHWRK